MMTAAIYARCYVPRDEPNAEQIAICRQYAEGKFLLHEGMIYRDGSSPERRMPRCGLEMVRLLIRCGMVGAVLVTEFSHISRDRSVLAKFLALAKSHKVRVIAVFDEMVRNEVVS